MSALAIVGIVLGVVVLCTLLGLGIVLGLRHLRERRGVTLTATADDTFVITTPVGPGSARLVVHEYRGRCFEVHTQFRGEQPQTIYVPPAPHLIVTAVQRRVDANVEARRSGVPAKR